MDQSAWKDFLNTINEPQTKMIASLLTDVRPQSYEDNKLFLACQSDGMRMFLDKKRQAIEKLISGYLKTDVSVEFVVNPTEDKKKKKQAQPGPLLNYQPSVDDLFTKAGLLKKYNFDNFAVSSSNQVAYAAAHSVAKDPGHSYNPLFLYGGVGNGKTHLAHAAACSILEKDNSKKIMFAPGDQFINELIECIREKRTPSFRKKYRYLGVLIIDDIQFIAGKQTVQEEFFHTFNSVVSAGGQIILTSDRPPSDIQNLEDRLRSRFSGGLIVDIQPPDFELRTAILLIKAQEKNIPIEMAAAQKIAEQITDTRALEGALLSIFAKTAGKEDMISLQIVNDHFHSSQQNIIIRKINPTQVIKTVCSYYGVKQSHIKSATRTSHIAFSRQVIMYILRNELSLKLEEIAYLLKRKDHTTIMHGVDRINREVMKDPTFKEEVDRIVSNIRSST